MQGLRAVFHSLSRWFWCQVGHEKHWAGPTPHFSHRREPQSVDITKLVQVTHLDPKPELMTSSLLLSLPLQITQIQPFTTGRGGERHWLILSWGEEVLTRGNSRQQWLPAWWWSLCNGRGCQVRARDRSSALRRPGQGQRRSSWCQPLSHWSSPCHLNTGGWVLLRWKRKMLSVTSWGGWPWPYQSPYDSFISFFYHPICLHLNATMLRQDTHRAAFAATHCGGVSGIQNSLGKGKENKRLVRT